MLLTFPGFNYHMYLLLTEREILSSGNTNLRHKILTVCLPDRVGMYGLECFQSGYNPYLESTEFSLWFPGQLPIWSAGNLFPNVFKSTADDLCASVEAKQYDEVLVFGFEMVKPAEEVIAFAYEHAVKIKNFATKGSAAFVRVNALAGTRMQLVAG